MKKTIAAFALVASSSALALGPPSRQQPPKKTVCFKVSTVKSGKNKLSYAGCDHTNNNQRAHLENLENGCPAGQVSLTVDADADIHACMPPGLTQL